MSERGEMHQVWVVACRTGPGTSRWGWEGHGLGQWRLVDVWVVPGAAAVRQDALGSVDRSGVLPVGQDACGVSVWRVMGRCALERSWAALGHVQRGRAVRGTSGVVAARRRGLGRIGEGRERLSDLGAWRGHGWGPLRGSVRAGAPWRGGCTSRWDGARQRGGHGASSRIRRCGAGRGHVRERRGASGLGRACVTRSRRHGARLVWWPMEGHVSGVMGVTCCWRCSRWRGLGWPGGMAGKGAMNPDD